jgi:hypothetical protein
VKEIAWWALVVMSSYALVYGSAWYGEIIAGIQ